MRGFHCLLHDILRSTRSRVLTQEHIVNHNKGHMMKVREVGSYVRLHNYPGSTDPPHCQTLSRSTCLKVRMRGLKIALIRTGIFQPQAFCLISILTFWFLAKNKLGANKKRRFPGSYPMLRAPLVGFLSWGKPKLKEAMYFWVVPERIELTTACFARNWNLSRWEICVAYCRLVVSFWFLIQSIQKAVPCERGPSCQW